MVRPRRKLIFLIQIIESGSEPILWLNPSAIMDLEYHGMSLVVPTNLIAGHLGAGFVLLALSAVLWTASPEVASGGFW